VLPGQGLLHPTSTDPPQLTTGSGIVEQIADEAREVLDLAGWGVPRGLIGEGAHLPQVERDDRQTEGHVLESLDR
jgi:hypothetical protein